MLDASQLIELIPRAVLWAQEQEQYILENGILLSHSQREDARAVPVVSPENVRLLGVNQIPLPEDPELKSAAQHIGLITPRTDGLTLRYGIFIREGFLDNRRLVVHELVYVPI